jgi:hypothetical protein
MHAVAQVLDIIGRVIARYLERPVQGYDPFTPRPQEHFRSHALPVSIAGAAAVAPARHRPWFGQSDPPHLLGAHRASFRGRPLSDSTENYAARKRGGATGVFWRSAIRRSTRRAISISRRTSRSSNRPWPRSSTINVCIGPICRRQATSMSRYRREYVGQAAI